MRFRPAIPLFAACLILAHALPAFAQNVESGARIVGRVVDNESKRPVVGALIGVNGVESRASTDERGSFRVDHVPAGSRAMTIEMIGYATRTESIAVRAGATHEIEVLLSRQAIELTPIEVSVRSGFLEARGFYERERSSSGNFIDRNEIETRRPQLLTDLLRNVPGTRIHLLDPGRRHVRFNRGNAEVLAFSQDQQGLLPGCEPDVYVDGQQRRDRIPNNPREHKLDDFDVVSPDEVEGIEVYKGATGPMQYQSSSCGVILIWTRRGNVVAAPPRTGMATALTMPDLPVGTLLRITPRLGGGRVAGLIQSTQPGSLVVAPRNGEPITFGVDDIRKLEQSAGRARFVERSWRGARWGLVLGLVGVAVAAAAEEFGELDDGGETAPIADNSPRNPMFGVKVVSATTLAGALLGGSFWRYQKWVEVRIR
ncbi:MAG: carboxypeptidase-like regulatory domain-containing protein [Longimicrobiales bacterium]